MGEPSNLFEVYGVSGPEAQHRVVKALRRKPYLEVETDERDGSCFVLVLCDRPSRAHRIFNKVTSIDDGAILVLATADPQPTAA